MKETKVNELFEEMVPELKLDDLFLQSLPPVDKDAKIEELLKQLKSAKAKIEFQKIVQKQPDIIEVEDSYVPEPKLDELNLRSGASEGLTFFKCTGMHIR